MNMSDISNKINLQFYDLYRQHIENYILYTQVIEIQDFEPKDFEILQNLLLQYQNSLFEMLLILFWYLNHILGTILFVYQFQLWFNKIRNQTKDAEPNFYALSSMVLLSTFSTFMFIYLVNHYLQVPEVGIFTAYPFHDILELFLFDYKIYMELKWLKANKKVNDWNFKNKNNK